MPGLAEGIEEHHCSSQNTRSLDKTPQCQLLRQLLWLTAVQCCTHISCDIVIQNTAALGYEIQVSAAARIMCSIEVEGSVDGSKIVGRQSWLCSDAQLAIVGNCLRPLRKIYMRNMELGPIAFADSQVSLRRIAMQLAAAWRTDSRLYLCFRFQSSSTYCKRAKKPINKPNYC
jgi:hypothetical protein